MQIAQENKSIPEISINPLSWWQWWVSPRAETREDAFYERNVRGITALFLLIMVLITVIFVPQGVLAGYELLLVIMFVLTVIPMIAVANNHSSIAGWILSATLTFTAMSSLLSSGYWAPNAVGIVLIIPILVALLIRNNWAKLFYVFVVPVLFAVVAFYQESTGSTSIFDPSYSFSTASGASIMFAIMVFLMAGGGGYMLLEFNAQQRDLKAFANTLELRVAERTRDIEVAASVSAKVTSIREQEELLQEIVNLTRDGFSLDQVSVYLYDESTKQLTIATASGSASQTMLDEKRSFSMDAKGLVPLAARQGKAVIINDVQQSHDHVANPHLAKTQSELALPIRVGNSLIGVLDLQSHQTNRFSDDDVRAITPLAEQIGIGVESTHLYAQQDELIEQLRNADQMKSQFLASMSHELRTPLNSILTFSDLMTMGTFGDVNEEQTEYLQKILFSGRHLLALINDVLDISKMESGMMKLFVEEDFDIAHEVETARATVEKMIGENPVELQVDLDAELPVLTVDKRRIRQVLLNILSNAVKFTEEGTITLSAKKKRDEILFAVIDTGPGIAEDQYEQIFEPFVQTETGIKHAGGTGLGLPISKRLVEAHGGRLWLESTKGEGSAFFFTLPLVPVVQPGEVSMKTH